MRKVWERSRTIVILAAAAVMAIWLGQGTEPLAAGARAPHLEVVTSEGRLPLAGAGVTVVNFWGTYCPPCRAEAPVLSRAHAALLREGGRVVGISTDRASLDDVVAFAHRLGMRYPIGVANDDLLSRYRVDRLPTTYVVASNGRISASFVGALTDAQIDRAIRSARRVR